MCRRTLSLVPSWKVCLGPLLGLSLSGESLCFLFVLCLFACLCFLFATWVCLAIAHLHGCHEQRSPFQFGVHVFPLQWCAVRSPLPLGSNGVPCARTRGFPRQQIHIQLAWALVREHLLPIALQGKRQRNLGRRLCGKLLWLLKKKGSAYVLDALGSNC